MAKYTYTTPATTKPRRSDNPNYTTAVVAVYSGVAVERPPRDKADAEYMNGVNKFARKMAAERKGTREIVSCHASVATALQQANKCAEGKGGTVATWHAYLAGASFEVLPLTRTER